MGCEASRAEREFESWLIAEVVAACEHMVILRAALPRSLKTFVIFLISDGWVTNLATTDLRIPVGHVRGKPVITNVGEGGSVCENCWGSFCRWGSANMRKPDSMPTAMKTVLEDSELAATSAL